MLKKLFLLVAIGLMSLSCSQNTPVKFKNMINVSASNGIKFKMPEKYEYVELGNEIRVRPVEDERRKLRVPDDIRIKLIDAISNNGSYKIKNLEGREIHYKIIEDEGGSAGPGFELRAWIKIKNNFVLITSYTQTERGQPNFDVAWAIIPTIVIN